MRPTLDADPQPDHELVSRAQAGDADAFSRLFDRHYLRLARFVRQFGLEPSDVEDVLSETFLRAFGKIAAFDLESGTRYVSYLYAIARNLVTDRLRRRGRMPEMADIEAADREPDLRYPGPEECALLRDDVARIRAAMEALPSSDREIISLSYDRELSCREIQKIMGKPSVSAVTTHLSKAMKRLRQLLAQTESTR